MSRKSRRGAVNLPKHVHPVPARGKLYYYYQEHRNTPRQGPRISLPKDPHSPEFWHAVRQAQGLSPEAPVNTIGAAIDVFLAHCEKRVVADDLSEGTLDQYRRAMKLARGAWGDLPAKGLRPVHVQTIIDKLAEQPGKANNFLGGMRAFSTWARARDHVEWSLTEGVVPYSVTGGHQPWTPEQINAALTGLTGVVRKGFILYKCTGMRGSDVVRLGPTMIDDGGFDLGWRGQVKTGVRPWCPILPELAAEMATWEKRPGPFLLQEGGRAHGKPYTRKLFWTHFKQQADKIPELAGVTLHGLRATAVIELRRAGLEIGQIGDIVGMSLPMIERYCRFADRKTSGQAALLTLKGTRGEQNCKTLQNSKTKK